MENNTFFERHPKKTIAGTILILLLLASGAAELVLRASGFLPEGTYYKTPDTLVVSDRYYTDQEGIFKANPASKEWGKHTRINKEGFRGDAFTTTPGKKSILILGDSFAWGANAKPITNSFPDLLHKEGYHVFNTGIPGTGPTQYEYLANKYIPLLRPDYVIVCLYMGNDLKEAPEPMVPAKSLYHVTNAGWIRGFDRQDRPLNPVEAYSYYIGTSGNKLKRLVKSTSMGTAIWKLLSESKIIFTRFPEEKNNPSQSTEKRSSLIDRYSYTLQTIQNIFTLSQSTGTQPFLLVIPAYGTHCCNNSTKEIKHYRPVFDKLNPIYLDDMPGETFFGAPNCHLNNDGHTFVMKRILTVINNK